MKPNQDIRQPLFQVWESLKQLAVELNNEELDHSVVEVLLADAMVRLDDANEAWMKTRPTPVKYVLGTDDESGNFQMLVGPTAKLQELFDFFSAKQKTIFDNLYIIKFAENEDDSKDEVIYRWGGEWEKTA